jgi:hypothetical protein
MARNTTLGQLVTMLRDEAGHSNSAALGQNTLATLKTMLRRTQEVLWMDYPWPHLEVSRDVSLAAGQRYYSFPTDLSVNHRITSAHVLHDENWRELENGIALEHYNASNPDDDDREDPAVRWAMYESDQFEVWPLPASNNDTVRLRGTRNLNPLISETDTADLDDWLLVLYCAAELAQKQKQSNAQAKLSLAQQHYARLKGTQSNKGRFRLAGTATVREGNTGPKVPHPLYGGKIE